MKDLIGALPIVAKTLGDKYGVTVEIGGRQACTDGQVIYLPSLPSDDEACAILARGYLDHEAAHVRFTEGDLEGSPLERAIQNILEDVRIEKAMGERFPGCRTNLRRLVRKLVEDGDFKAPSENAHPSVVLQSYLLHRLRAGVLGQDALDELANESEKRFRQTFSDGMAVRIAAIGWEVEMARSTDDVKALTSRIMKALEDEQEQPETGDASGNGDTNAGNDASGNGDTNAGNDASGNGDTNAGNDTSGNGDTNAGNDASGNGVTNAGSNSKGSESAKRALEASANDIGPDMAEIVANKLTRQADVNSFSTVTVAVDVGDNGAPDLHQGPRPDPQKARRATNALRARLEGLIQSTRLDRPRRSRAGVKIDTREIHRLAVGDPRVFRVQRERIAVNTAIHILLDKSGSMSYGMAVANEAVYALTMALAAIPGIAVQTAVFPVRKKDISIRTRFGERVYARDYAIKAEGGTPLAAPLWRVSYELMTRPETRKMALIVTDGEPYDPIEAKDVIQRMTASGIEVLGLGIGRMKMEDLFPVYETIQSVQELPQAMFRMLQERLVPQVA